LPAQSSFTFVLANPMGLLALDATGQVLGQIVQLPPDSAPSAPALSPDRRSIVFSITLIPSGPSGFGSDIWAVDIGGANLRRLVEHERENVFYASPLMDPAGKFLYVHRRAAIIENGSYVGNDDSIERVDLATKERTRLVENAAEPTLSRDGKTLVYVRIEDGAPKGLWRVGTDGAGAGPFFSTTDTWWYLQAPRFSPDGSALVFSGAGHARAQGGGVKLAHLGIPSDLYLATADGKSVKSIGQTGDDVAPAWSPDGAQVAYVAAGALHVQTIADGKLQQLSRSDNFFFGDLLWLRK
jgi:Tol biopolymer transport system component